MARAVQRRRIDYRCSGLWQRMALAKALGGPLRAEFCDPDRTKFCPESAACGFYEDRSKTRRETGSRFAALEQSKFAVNSKRDLADCHGRVTLPRDRSGVPRAPT